MHPFNNWNPEFNYNDEKLANFVYLTAAQAREQATTLINDKNRKEFDAVMKRIHEACKKGELRTAVESLSPWVAKELEKLGYRTMHYADQRDQEDYYTVSWVD